MAGQGGDTHTPNPNGGLGGGANANANANANASTNANTNVNATAYTTQVQPAQPQVQSTGTPDEPGASNTQVKRPNPPQPNTHWSDMLGMKGISMLLDLIISLLMLIMEVIVAPIRAGYRLYQKYTGTEEAPANTPQQLAPQLAPPAQQLGPQAQQVRNGLAHLEEHIGGGNVDEAAAKLRAAMTNHQPPATQASPTIERAREP